MSELTVQELSSSGVNPTMSAAASGGDSFVNDDRTILYAVNSDGSNDHTITVTAQRTSFELRNQGFGSVSFSDLTITVPMGDDIWVAIPPAPYNDGNGKAQLTYAIAGSITVAAVKRPQ